MSDSLLRRARPRIGFPGVVELMRSALHRMIESAARVVEPKRDTALIGAIVLEDLDLLVDGRAQKLRPRDPRFIIAELE